jgi:hypothetical protein
MQNAHEFQSADIWRLAQLRRAADLSNWSKSYFETRERSRESDITRQPVTLRFAGGRALTIALVTFAALTSVSAVVHAGKRTQLELRPTASMPPVNVP